MRKVREFYLLETKFFQDSFSEQELAMSVRISHMLMDFYLRIKMNLNCGIGFFFVCVCVCVCHNFITYAGWDFSIWIKLFFYILFFLRVFILQNDAKSPVLFIFIINKIIKLSISVICVLAWKIVIFCCLSFFYV